MLNRGQNESGRTISSFKSSRKPLETPAAVSGESSSWLVKPEVVEEPINVHSVLLTIDRVLLAARSSKVADILARDPYEDLSRALRDMPGNQRTFQQVARFCHGHHPTITSGNCVPLFCMAHYLGMTEAHSQGNLLPRVSRFIRDEILPSWNESVEALRASEAVVETAAELGLVDALVASIVSEAGSDPRRVGDLTTLPLRLYEPVVLGMIRNGMPSRYVVSSLCEYVKKWVSPFVASGRSNASRIRAKEVVEAVERMLPDEGGLVPCVVLFEMLRIAAVLDASSECRKGLEQRIGRRLDLATAKDLLILKEIEYDVECLKRMLKIFYGSFVDRSGAQGPLMSGLVRVAALMEEFLAEAAGDADLKPDAFAQLAEVSAAASSGANRCSDGIYRAIHIYLDKHRNLTEAERDRACQVLDCSMMSPEAVEHAARNELLPLRIVVRTVLADQMILRSVIARVEEERGQAVGSEMDGKVTEPGRVSPVVQQKIEPRKEKSGGGIWKEMKRKFGCMSSSNSSSSLNNVHDCNCQVIKKRKKVHPRRH